MLFRSEGLKVVAFIPYGTIKRRNISALVFRTSISIPYGTIKRAILDVVNAILSEFQFPMVRLKDHIGLLPQNGRFEFQFLMVRLKDGIL